MIIKDVSKKLTVYSIIELLKEDADDFSNCQFVLDSLFKHLEGHPDYVMLENDLSDLVLFVGRKLFVKGFHEGFKLYRLLLDMPESEYI